MVTPLGLIARLARPARLVPPSLGRCPVCHQDVQDPAGMLTLRGGIQVHRECATYRVRQRARAI
jgi:hypothetical protein